MRFFVVAVITMLAITPALAQDTKASAESIKQLFELMHANSLLDNVMQQINADARAAQTQSLAPKIMQLEKDSAARVKAAANPQSTAPPASQPPQPPQSAQPPPSH